MKEAKQEAIFLGGDVLNINARIDAFCDKIDEIFKHAWDDGVAGVQVVNASSMLSQGGAGFVFVDGRSFDYRKLSRKTMNNGGKGLSATYRCESWGNSRCSDLSKTPSQVVGICNLLSRWSEYEGGVEWDGDSDMTPNGDGVQFSTPQGS